MEHDQTADHTNIRAAIWRHACLSERHCYEPESFSGSERWDFRRVTTVTPNFDAGRTRVEWAIPLGTTSPHVVLPSANPKVYALRVRASLFGFNAPHPLTLSNDVR